MKINRLIDDAFIDENLFKNTFKESSVFAKGGHEFLVKLFMGIIEYSGGSSLQTDNKKLFLWATENANEFESLILRMIFLYHINTHTFYSNFEKSNKIDHYGKLNNQEKLSFLISDNILPKESGAYLKDKNLMNLVISAWENLK